MTKNAFDEFDSAGAGNSFDEFDKPAKKSGPIRRLADTGLALGKGIIGAPEAAVGIADLVTAGQAGKIAEQAGVRFKDAKQVLTDLQSPEQHAADAEVQQAEGFLPTVGAMVQNPSTIANSVAESAPSMLAGGVVSRGALALAPKLSPIVAGAIGEGATAAGQNAEQVRQEDPNGTLTGQQAAILAASGGITGVIGALSGRIANKLGIADKETMLATGKLGPVGEEAAAKAASKGTARKIAEGAVVEGGLQELPQSYQEQVAQNVAQGKPWDEGAGAAAAQGLLVGGVMGGGAAALSGEHAPAPPPAPTARPMGPIARAAALLPNNPTLFADAEGTVLTGEQKAASRFAATNGQATDVTPIAPAPAAQPLLTAPIDVAAHEAATSPNNIRPAPTTAQEDAGNYKKGHERIGGMGISLENGQGSVRKGVSEDGTPWQTELQDHYGYLKGTIAADSTDTKRQGIDVFVKPGTPKEFNGPLFVVDQVDPKTGKFDEHKVIFGASSIEDAQQTYLRNYSPGWQGLGAITEADQKTFKAWAYDGKKKSTPFGTIAAPAAVDAAAAPAGAAPGSPAEVHSAAAPADQPNPSLGAPNAPQPDLHIGEHADVQPAATERGPAAAPEAAGPVAAPAAPRPDGAPPVASHPDAAAGAPADQRAQGNDGAAAGNANQSAAAGQGGEGTVPGSVDAGSGVRHGPGADAAKPLTVGPTPAQTEPITVKDGTVHIGKNAAVNFDTGEPVTVPAGATHAQIKQALRDAGAVSAKQKFYGGDKEAPPAPSPAPAPTADGRPGNWRSNFMVATQIAKRAGIPYVQGRKLQELVDLVDEADTKAGRAPAPVAVNAPTTTPVADQKQPEVSDKPAPSPAPTAAPAATPAPTAPPQPTPAPTEAPKKNALVEAKAKRDAEDEAQLKAMGRSDFEGGGRRAAPQALSPANQKLWLEGWDVANANARAPEPTAAPVPVVAPPPVPREQQLRLMDKQISVLEALQRCLKGG